MFIKQELIVDRPISIKSDYHSLLFDNLENTISFEIVIRLQANAEEKFNIVFECTPNDTNNQMNNYIVFINDKRYTHTPLSEVCNILGLSDKEREYFIMHVTNIYEQHYYVYQYALSLNKWVDC